MTGSPVRSHSGDGDRMHGPSYRGFLIAIHTAGKRKFVKRPFFSRATDSAHFAIREWMNTKRLGLHLVGFLVTIALLVYLGPFGTWASLAVADRLVFWTTTVGVNWLVAVAALNVTIRAFQTREWPSWAGLVLAGLITAVPGTGTVWLIVAAYLGYRPSDVSGIIELYTQVLVLHLMIGSLAFYFIKRSLRQRDARVERSPPGGRVHAVSHAAPEAALLSRLPARSRAELLHLRMQDHYVEVHTAAGTEMLLLRFRDALHEVEDVNGLRVHRSHWVARAAIVGVERGRGGRVALRLVNGSRIPVSRSFAPALKARGWI